MDKEWTFIDLISILSFIVGMQNLELNEQQVANLDRHLNKQDTELLAKIIQQNEEIIELLKE